MHSCVPISRHVFVAFLVPFIFLEFYFLWSFKADTVCGHSFWLFNQTNCRIQKVTKPLVNKWSERKTDKLRSRRPFVLTNCWRKVNQKSELKNKNYAWKTAKILQLVLHNIKVSSTNGTPFSLRDLSISLRTTLTPRRNWNQWLCKILRGIQDASRSWLKMVNGVEIPRKAFKSERSGAHFKSGSESGREHLACLWRDNSQRFIAPNTGRAKRAT